MLGGAADTVVLQLGKVTSMSSLVGSPGAKSPEPTPLATATSAPAGASLSRKPSMRGSPIRDATAKPGKKGAHGSKSGHHHSHHHQRRKRRRRRKQAKQEEEIDAILRREMERLSTEQKLSKLMERQEGMKVDRIKGCVAGICCANDIADRVFAAATPATLTTSRRTGRARQ